MNKSAGNNPPSFEWPGIVPGHLRDSGQSMGGMQILDLAARRDNYFAGIWAIGAQWVQGKFANVKIAHTSWNQATTSTADANAKLLALMSTRSVLGAYWNALDNGDHKSTRTYAPGISHRSDWLLSQTKQSEDSGGVLTPVIRP